MSESLAQDNASQWFLYLIRCHKGTLYTGITTDVERRFAEHQSGGAKAARYLRGKGPLELVYTTVAGNRAQASMLEYQIKLLPRAAKQSLVAGLIDIASVFPADCSPNNNEGNKL